MQRRLFILRCFVSFFSVADKSFFFSFFFVLLFVMQGEDTFGDSESEEEDVMVTANGDGMRSRLGLGASLQSLVHGAGNGPTCTLSEHPIQVGLVWLYIT